MNDDEIVTRAISVMREMPMFSTMEAKAEAIVHAVGPLITAQHDRVLAKRYAGRFPVVANDLRGEAERMDRRGRMVEPA